MNEKRAGKDQKWGWDPWLWAPKAWIFIAFYVALLVIPSNSYLHHLKWVVLGWAAWLLFLPVVWILIRLLGVLAPVLSRIFRSGIKQLKRLVSMKEQVGELLHKSIDIVTMVGTFGLGLAAYTLASLNIVNSVFVHTQGREKMTFIVVWFAFSGILLIDLVYVAKRMQRSDGIVNFLGSDTWFKRYWKNWCGNGREKKEKQ